MNLPGDDVELQAKSESHLLTRPTDHQARRKLIGWIPRVLISIVVGILGGAAFYVFMFGLTFVVMHKVSSEMWLFFFILLLDVGAPIAGVLVGLLTYRVLSR